MTRDGQILGTEDSQDRLTTFLYNSRIGNLALKVLTLPCLSKLAGAFLAQDAEIREYMKKVTAQMLEIIELKKLLGQ